MISDDTVVRPDVMVICGGVPEEFLRSVPALIAEVVSKRTSTRDREFKRDLYRQQGVAVHLLTDPDAETLKIDRKDTEGRWQHANIDHAVDFRICGNCEHGSTGPRSIGAERSGE